MIKYLLLLLMAVNLNAYPVIMMRVQSSDFTGKVVGVSDGDTITVLDENKVQHKIRLYGIDAPEKKQPFGQKAKQHLSEMVFGKEVKVYVVNKDRYGRLVAKLNFVDVESINDIMIQDGYAWAYLTYLRKLDRQSYQNLELEARKDRRGLWADPKPTPPWEYRKSKKRK